MGEEWSNSVSVLCANLIPIFWCVSSAFVYKLIYAHAVCVFECVCLFEVSLGLESPD